MNSPKNLICAHQSEDKSYLPDKRKNISILDHLDLRKFFVEIDRARFPKDSFLTKYDLNDYLDQYKDVKLIYREYVVETLMNPFKSDTSMKNKYPIQVIDLRFQVDHIAPQKTQLFEEYRNANPRHAR